MPKKGYKQTEEHKRKKAKSRTIWNKILTKKFLIKEYTKNSTREIAKKVKCSKPTVLYYLKKYKIRIKTPSESLKGKYVGKKNGNYKDGRSKNHKCVDCGKKIGYYSWKYGQGRCRPCSLKHLWKNEKFRKNRIASQRKGMKLKPNKPEKLLNKLLPKEYKYNKSFIIAGLVPDFVNKKKKKIIELYGCYWHKCPECGFGNGRRVDKNRIGIYDLFANYKTLIIWEHELKNLEKVKSKILKFNNG